MREEPDDKLESTADVASLTRIRVRRPTGAAALQRKAKSGDITDRLQALAEELEASRPAVVAETPVPMPTPAPATARASLDNGSPRVRTPAKTRRKALPPETAAETAPPVPRADITPPRPALPPRRAHLARPAVTTGWQRTVASRDILSYWMDIRGTQRYPNWRDLDTAMIGRHWPDCTLVQCDHALGRMQIETAFVSAVRRATERESSDRSVNAAVEFSPMIIDWVLSLAREVATSGKPAHATEYFPSTFDEITLRVIALPLSEDQIEIDHVLCYVQKLG